MNNNIDFKDFFELSEDERLEYLLQYTKLNFVQKIQVKLLCKWASAIEKANPHLKPYVLWESIYKGRF